MTFKPQLITNNSIPDDAPFPRLVSIKRHGICIIVHPKYDLILGRSLKPIKNKQFQERFRPLLTHCKMKNIIIHGEAHIDGAISDDMAHFLNTIDHDNHNTTSINRVEENIASGKFKLPKELYCTLPDELKIYAFDCIEIGYEHFPYLVRLEKLKNMLYFSNLIQIMDQIEVQNQTVEDNIYIRSLEMGHEGIVIRYNKSYKFGRSTVKEHLIYKRVPTPTFDGRIIAINQATVVNKNVEKTTNELGKSVTSKKKGDRILIEQAKDFQVGMILEGQTEPINFGVAMKGFNHEDRKLAWKYPHNYIGKMIEFECKDYKGIGKPKSAAFIRFREDKD